MAKQQDLPFTELVHAISHDFRAPVRHIREFFNLLLEEQSNQLSDQQQIYKNYIDSSILEINEQIERLLTYSRLFSREYTITEIDLVDLLQEVVQQFPEQQQTRIQLSITPDGINPRYAVIKEKLQLAVYELLKNALTFQPPQSQSPVDLTLSISPEGILIQVSDSGIGIAPGSIDAAFMPYRQLNNKSDYPGCGMGLTIAKACVEQMNGKISLRSDEQGVDALITLPLLNNH